MDNSALFETVRHIDFFKKFPELTLKNLLKEATVHNKKKGSILFLQGDKASLFYILVKGSLGNYLQTEEGKQVFLKLVPEGGYVGETALVQNSYYPYTVQVLSESILLGIPAEILHAYIQQGGEASQRMVEIAINAAHEHVAHISQHTTLSATQRLACYILKLIKPSQTTNVSVALPTEKNLIAAYLQITPETFSRAIMKLKVIGVEFKRRTVFVKDATLLSEFCCTSCAKVALPFEHECVSSLLDK